MEKNTEALGETMERIDKIISAQTEYSRKDVKKLVFQKRVRLNGELIFKSDINAYNNMTVMR